MSNTDSLTRKSEDRIHYLDSLRAIAILMVIGVHTLAYSTPLSAKESAIVTFIVHTVAVPVFFFADGYLFARSIIALKKFSYLDTLKKSLYRLLLPWMTFTVIYCICRYLFELAGAANDKLILGRSFYEITYSCYLSVYSPQMYFLFSLFLIRFISPIFLCIIRIQNCLLFFSTYFTFLLLYCLFYPYATSYLAVTGGYDPILHAVWGIQFYFFGIVIFKTLTQFKLRSLGQPALLFFLMLFAVLFLPNGAQPYFIQYTYLLIIFLFFYFLNKEIPLIKYIGKNTMGIYLLHAPIVIRGVSIIANKLPVTPIFNYFIVATFTLAVTLAIVTAIKAIPYGCLLFGEEYKRIKNVDYKNLI